VSKPFDTNTNPKNTLIGTALNAYLNFSLQNEYKISDKVSADAGIGFMHLSNGGTVLPNLGLNTPVIFAGLRYNLGKEEIISRTLTDTIDRKWKYHLYATIAIKQAPWVGGDYYLINALQAEAMKKINRNNALGGGVIFFYNRTLQYFPMESPNVVQTRKKFQVGVYASYEHFLGRLSIPVQLGFYAYNKDKSLPVFTQFGARYRISKHWSTELLLKSHAGQADFIHTGVGYTF